MITVNDRGYRPGAAPVVGICLDGTDPEYIEAHKNVMPNLNRFRAAGSGGIARSVIPSFTNPNNVAIATGVPPSVNGICGNYYYDSTIDAEVMMNDPAYLRCPTIFSEFARTGEPAAVVTTKEKLRLLLGKDLKGICFSVERVHEAAKDSELVAKMISELETPVPGIYDPDISIYCLEAGFWLLKHAQPKLLYLSTTDFVQHKYPPGSAEAEDFYSKVDKCLGAMDALGAVLAITADHGMNDKVCADGKPRIQFIESLLLDQGFQDVRVILPITDPYVVHHGALGSFATVYLPAGSKQPAAEFLRSLPGIELVLEQQEAGERFHLPADRIGDLVVLGDKNTTLGKTPAWHDLAAVGSGLRSHGGLHEQCVPFVLNRKLRPEYAAKLQSSETNNFDLFDFAFNGWME